MSRFRHIILAIAFAAAAYITAVPRSNAASIAAMIASAKPGATVVLPAGTFTVGKLAISGITVKGAGYGQTILVCANGGGITVKGTYACVSDLTVRDADGDGIALNGVPSALISRVRVVKCLNGITVTNSNNVNIVNCVLGENRTGVVFNGVKNSDIVNCTMARNSALGQAISNTAGCASFNNALVTNSIGTYIAPGNVNLTVDHNAYWGALIGKGKDRAMSSIASWRDMENQDTHSPLIEIQLSDPDNFVYKPTLAMSWEPDRPTTAGWGAIKLGAFTAPEHDVDGIAWTNGQAAGAWNASFSVDRRPDREITIGSDNGVKSAGLYDSTNHEVAWLFNCLPLHAGRYPFWLPGRDWRGRPIAAGIYTVKVSEANLALKYVNSIGNQAVEPADEAYANMGVKQVIYDSKDRPVLCLDWTESYRQLRAMDSGLTHERWMVPGSNTDFGAASDGHGMIYSLRDTDKDTYVLSPVDEETGNIKQTSPNRFGFYFPKTSVGNIMGIAVDSGKIYMASNDQNKLYVGSVTDAVMSSSIAVNAPSWPAADHGRGWIWVVSGNKQLLAFDANGTVKVTFTPTLPEVYSVAVNGNRMALVSPSAGKVALYDITDPAHPALVRTLGTGDGPYGPLQMDRFTFQGVSPVYRANVAISGDGTVAVADYFGPKLFGWDGTPKRDYTGIWGQYIERCDMGPGRHMELLDISSMRTYVLDDTTGKVTPGAYYQVPPIVTPSTNIGYMFMRDGKRYGVSPADYVGIDGKTKVGVLLITRYDTARGTPLVIYKAGQPGLMQRTDFTRPLTDESGWQPVLANGKQVSASFLGETNIPRADGGLEFGGNLFTIVPLVGLDSSGVPVYDFAHMTGANLASDTGGHTVISPYDFKTVEDFPSWSRHAEQFPDGTIAAIGRMQKTAPNMSGFANWGGSCVAGFDAAGRERWVQTMPAIKDPEGAKVLDNLCYTMSVPLSEVQITDKDGLYIGAAGVPRQLFWHGMWLDNSHQYVAYKGSDGGHYIIYGNFNDCTAWWMKVTGLDTISYHSIPVTIASPPAGLASLPMPPTYHAPDNSPVNVLVKRLDAPMTIDGDLAKWRKILPNPQVAITPETGTDTNGPADCSATVRFAYEGSNLYVQVIRFDDVISMYQPLSLFYKSDTIEMSLNSFLTGIKVNVTHTIDHGDVVYRDGWFLKPKLLDPSLAPCKIVVLPNAHDITERTVIEHTYGVDLSNSPVVIYEYKVPLTDDTYENRLDQKPLIGPGKSIHIGIGVDDNDCPGADQQKMIVWPATYGTFAPVSTSAVVTFE